MFSLKECSVCFEDYTAERPPHNIECGHVFCGPCLALLAIGSPNCPTCRAVFSSTSIRQIAGDFEDPASIRRPSPVHESDGDALLWQIVQNAAECPEDPSQRKFLVGLWSEQGATEENLSENALATFVLLNLLVQVDDTRHVLEERLETSQAVERSLCDRISSLESQLVDKTVYPSVYDLQSFMSEFRKLQSTVDVIHKHTCGSTPGPIPNTVPPSIIANEHTEALPSPTPIASSGSSETSDLIAAIQTPTEESAPEFNFMNNFGRADDCPPMPPSVQPPNYAVRII